MKYIRLVTMEIKVSFLPNPLVSEMVQWTTDHKNELERHSCRCHTAEICR